MSVVGAARRHRHLGRCVLVWVGVCWCVLAVLVVVSWFYHP